LSHVYDGCSDIGSFLTIASITFVWKFPFSLSYLTNAKH
jgi:hypothetical protein